MADPQQPGITPDDIKPLTAAEQALKQTLLDTGAILRSITDKEFRALINATKEYQDRLDDINKSLEEEIGAYAEIKNYVSGMAQAIRQNASILRDERDILSGAAAIQKDILKSTDDLVYNRTRLLSGELSSREVLQDLGDAQGQLLAIETQKVALTDRAKQLEEEAYLAFQDGDTERSQALSAQAKALGEISDQLDTAKQAASDLTKEYEKQLKAVLKIESKVGIAGKLLKGFSKIPVLGDMLDFGGAEKAMNRVAASGASGFKVLQAGARALGPSLAAALGPLGLILIAVKAISAIFSFFKDAMFAASEQATQISRELGISSDQAKVIRKNFYDIADGARDLGATTKGQLLLQKQVAEAQAKFNELLGTGIDLTRAYGDEGQRLLAQFTAVSKFLKLSEDEQKGILNLSLQTGEELKDIENTVLGTLRAYKLQTGIQINERKVLGDILKTSALIRLSIKGGTEALIQATLQAQKFGADLSKVNQIADGFLDFETSIQKEMEAEVLLGRELNYERLRFAALTNDTVTVTEELNRLIAEAGPDLQKNRLAMESLAQSANMSTDELANYIEKQKQSEQLRTSQLNLGEAEIDELERKKFITAEQSALLRQGKLDGVEFYNALKNSGKSAVEITKILGEQAAVSLEAQSAQDKFNEALEKAKETFTKFVEGGSLEKLANFITELVEGGLYNALFGTGKDQNENRAEVEELQKQGEKAVGAEEFQKRVQEESKNIGDGGFFDLDYMKYDLMNPLSAVGSIFSESLAKERQSVVEEYKKQLAIERAALSTGVQSSQAANMATEKATEVNNATNTATTQKPPLADGGVIEEGGVAEVDTGEVYLGMNTRETIASLAESSRRQVLALEQQTDRLTRYQEETNRLLQALIGKDTSIVVDGEVLARTTANVTVQQYGNQLNPASLMS